MSLLILAFADTDRSQAEHVRDHLQRDGFDVLMAMGTTPFGGDWNQVLMRAVQNATAVLVLVSPATHNSVEVLQAVNLARQHNRPLHALILRPTDPLPWFVNDITTHDLTIGFESRLRHLLGRTLGAGLSSTAMTFQQARDAYTNRASLKSLHTLASYERAITLFLTFLGDRKAGRLLPVQRIPFTEPGDIQLHELTNEDAPIFLHFAQWLLSPRTTSPDDHRPYRPSTVELRLAGLLSWFQFMDDYGWLPADFKLAKARRIVMDELRARPAHHGPPQPPEHIEEIISYYDFLSVPKALLKPNADPNRLRIWELTRLRNYALVQSLAETGGRVSEVLSLNLMDFPVRALHQEDVWRVEVIGKGNHRYYLRFFTALPAIRAYIDARGAEIRATSKGVAPLFVSHASKYEGQRMSRVVAWRVVQRAARSLGIGDITPHDFRHWRATQLINAGHSLDVVQEYLGHRSVETTRAYYAHTDPLRVDDAARNTQLPKPDTIE